MMIACPYCGPRDLCEFTCRGDASRMRPDPASTDLDAWNDHVYGRANPAGPHAEFWQHSGGCRMHMRVLRDTLTHAVIEVTPARKAGP